MLQGSGSAYSKGVNKRGAVEHFDKGIGYDENDSFIDTTDAVIRAIELPLISSPDSSSSFIPHPLITFHFVSHPFIVV